MIGLLVGLMTGCINSSINRSNDRSIGRSINMSVDRSVDMSVDRSIDGSVDRSVDMSVDRSFDGSIDGSIDRSTDRSIDRSINRSTTKMSKGGYDTCSRCRGPRNIPGGERLNLLDLRRSGTRGKNGGEMVPLHPGKKGGFIAIMGKSWQYYCKNGSYVLSLQAHRRPLHAPIHSFELLVQTYVASDTCRRSSHEDRTRRRQRETKTKNRHVLRAVARFNGKMGNIATGGTKERSLQYARCLSSRVLGCLVAFPCVVNAKQK